MDAGNVEFPNVDLKEGRSGIDLKESISNA